MPPDQSQPTSAPEAALPVSLERGGSVAMYVTIVAFSITTLLVQTQMWKDGRWIAYSIAVLLFTLLARQPVRLEEQPRLTFALLIGQMVILLIAIALSDYYFLTAMLSFITVSTSQADLPPRLANLFDVALLAVIAAVYWLAAGWDAVFQVGLGLGAGFVFVVAFTRVTHSEIQARRQLERTNAQLAEYAAQVEQLATMRERNRLARDVHDSLGHYLTVINVQLEVVTKLIDADPNRARDAALKAKQLASEGLAEVRRSVDALRPSPLDDRALPDAIRGLLDDARDAGLIVSFDQVGSARPLSPETETVLFRAAQESLTNIRKHARASSAGVRLAFEAEAVRLRVRDNGIGRQGDPDNVGLSALRERVAALNGSIVAENHPDGGFLLEVALPYPDVSLGAAKNLIHNTADPSLTALPFK
ncbi:MAG: sensor histidine kinase [Anaerolineae bacterium]